MPSFESIEADFLRVTSDVVWATAATVDSRGRPRTRIMHPSWEVVDRRPAGGVFAALRLDPWRVMVQTAEHAAEGRWYKRFRRDGE